MKQGVVSVLVVLMMGALLLTLGCSERKESPAPVAPAPAPAPAPQQEASAPAAAAEEAQTAEETAISGEELFVQNCAVCHPGGGNVINPERGITRSALEERGVATVEAIVQAMRTPPQMMPGFDEDSLSDEEAEAIALYILETFE